MELWPFKMLESSYCHGARDGALATLIMLAGLLALIVTVVSTWRPDVRRQYLFPALGVLVGILLWYANSTHGEAAATPAIEPQPVAPVSPVKPTDQAKPTGPLRRLIGDASAVPGPPVNGGKTSPDGSVEIICDLPEKYRLKNTGGNDNPGPYYSNPHHEPGKGSGLCVWTSINRSAWLQYVAVLEKLQEWMTHHEGGGYPKKVDDLLEKFCKEQGTPVPRYINHTAGDMNFLRAALKTGRQPAITYCGEDPHYRGKKVSHMVNLVYLGDKWACIADNNFCGDNDFVWMGVYEFEKRWKGFGMGWAVVLLDPPPPPIPHN